MKAPTSLLKAMLITAMIGATVTSCTTMKPTSSKGETHEILPEDKEGLLDKVKDLFRFGGGKPLPACGFR